MKKKVILLAVLLIILAACFIPVTHQKTIIIKSPFLTVYSLLSNAALWEDWRPDLRKASLTDSGKVTIQKDTTSFIIKYAHLALNVKTVEGSFAINEADNNKTINYDYLLIPDKNPNKTIITVNKKTTAFSYLTGIFKPVSFADTHITDLKNYMEVDSIHYGYKISKTRVLGINLIVTGKETLAKDRFTAAAKMLSSLLQYLKSNNLKQTQPLIAQFLAKGKDSSLVKVGLYIDKEVKGKNEITFERMPKNGALYGANYIGAFDKRQRAYISVKQYFTDHLYQSAILPFECYLDNKLPTSDTDKVNIRVIYATYF